MKQEQRPKLPWPRPDYVERANRRAELHTEGIRGIQADAVSRRDLTQALCVWRTYAMPLLIRSASASDLDTMWHMFQLVAAKGDSIPSSDSICREAFSAQWFAPNISTFVVADGDRVLGMSKVGPNHPDRGSHVSSATFIVNPPDQGKGLGRMLAEHSLELAERAGYFAMQFNFVVSSNKQAVSLYSRLGFAVIGTLPKAFNHSSLGYVDVFVMYRLLSKTDA